MPELAWAVPGQHIHLLLVFIHFCERLYSSAPFKEPKQINSTKFSSEVVLLPEGSVLVLTCEGMS